MQTAEITQHNPQLYALSGTLNFVTVPNLIQQTNHYIKNLILKKDSTIEFDLAQVNHSNSAALALLLEINKLTMQQHEIPVTFKNLPENLKVIAHVYGIKNELSLSN